ncbi:hypothetical protein GN244_ATG07134 [Phytophthora infestans]|uniref:Uncharacterized protein n=1 Tax=Phytophthora infestans TaxID=4787 RepID=A0A833WFV6_PHYIN|nr:hypothetical protein GN244_ATG07134 [Phytophthora infestans]
MRGQKRRTSVSDASADYLSEEESKNESQTHVDAQPDTELDVSRSRTTQVTLKDTTLDMWERFESSDIPSISDRR